MQLVRITNRCSAVLLAMSLLAVIPACEQHHPDASVSGAGDAASPAAEDNPYEIAGELIKRSITGPDGVHVAVEIDYQRLSELAAGKKPEASTGPFRDPLLAARLFAPHVGLPEDAVISLERVSPEAEEASGLFIAVARATGGGRSVKMRLVSEPDSNGKSTLWVLNDYDK